MKYQLPLLFMSALLLAGPARSQTENYVIDVARTSGDTIRTGLEPGASLQVQLANAVPGQGYNIQIKRTQNAPAPFALAGFAPAPASAAAAGRCANLDGLMTALSAKKTEKGISEVMAKIDIEVAKATTTNDPLCTADEAKDLQRKATDLTTRLVGQAMKLRTNETISIEVSRLDPGTKADGSDAKTLRWVHIISTGVKGVWYLTYGFSFVSDALSPEETFYTKSQDSSFVIRKQESRGPLSFVPSVMVHWMPTRCIDRTFSWSLTGGLGFDLENPVVMFGGSVLFNHNLGVHVGLAAHQQQRLLGKYHEEDIVDEDLSFEQLHEKKFAVDPFVSISFRFDGNPFKAAKAADKGGSADAAD